MWSLPLALWYLYRISSPTFNWINGRSFYQFQSVTKQSKFTWQNLPVFFISHVSNCLVQQNSFHHDHFLYSQLSFTSCYDFILLLPACLSFSCSYTCTHLAPLPLSLGKGPVVEVVIYGLWLLAPNRMFYSVVGGSCCLSPLHSGELR